METYEITIAAGTIAADVIYTSGETVTVLSGGTISNVEFRYKADSLTLAAGAVLQGNITVGVNTAVQGDISASGADLVWNLAHRKKEAGLLWSDLAAAAANSYSITVHPDQNKGTYRVAGNAAGFSGSISLYNSNGIFLGELSLDDPELDYDITRYTLGLNEAQELTLTVSSNITDDNYYVFLYKDNQLVQPLEEGQNHVISGGGDYDNLVVIESGLAGNIQLQQGGLVTAYAGSTVVGIDQRSGGRLRFDYVEGDTTILSGINPYGAFFVQNDQLVNVYGEYVGLTGNLSVRNYYSCGVFNSQDGVTITGIFSAGSGGTHFEHGTTLNQITVTGSNVFFYNGSHASEGTIANATFKGGGFDDLTIGYAYLQGGTFSNIEFIDGAQLAYSTTTLAGDVFFRNPLTVYTWAPGYLDAAGHTITLDYTRRHTGDGAMIPGRYVSEDAVLKLNLLVDQSIGTFKIASNDLCTEFTCIIHTDEGDIGTLTETATSFEWGNYVYSMTSRNELVIDISPNADESMNVLWWHSDHTFYHAADVSGIELATNAYTEMLVRRRGIAGDLYLRDGGLLRIDRTGIAVGIRQEQNGRLRFDYTAGDTTLISGFNQYGVFFVQNDLLKNVYGEDVNLAGAVTVQDYHSCGTFTAKEGVTVTGTFVGSSAYEDSSTFGDGTILTDLVISGRNIDIYNVTATNIELHGGNIHAGTFSSSTFHGTTFRGNSITMSDATWYGGTLYYGAVVSLAGTLTIKSNIGAYSNSNIKANGNTIVLDYTTRKTADGAILSQSNVSEDVTFQIDLLSEQSIGTYTILSNAGMFQDLFNISVGGTIIGSMDRDNAWLDVGNYTYDMQWSNLTQNITLTIGISENADENFNILCYGSDDTFTHYREAQGFVIDGGTIASLVVQRNGWFADGRLNSGLMTVRRGGTVFGLNQSDGKLRFDYVEGDTTLITGINRYGVFFVQNDMLRNVCGENVTVSGNVLVENYHSEGSFTATGARIAGYFHGGGTFNGCTINNAVITGNSTFTGYSVITGSSLAGATVSTGIFSDVVFNGSVSLSGGTYSNVSLGNGGSVRNLIDLDGKMTISNALSCVEGYYENGVIGANGQELSLDLTKRDTVSGAMININRVYDADLTVTVYANQTIGTYTLASKAQNIGEIDEEGVWDIDTNVWRFKGSVSGDLDGIISIRSTDDIVLANCTINGATEYFGRYNYRVFTDENNDLRLSIGWNNRGGRTYEDDGLDNHTFATAYQIEGSGEGRLEALTIATDTEEDYFRFTLERSGKKSSSIGVEFKQWFGDIDIVLYDAAGNMVDYAESVTDNETISLQGLAAGDYYLKVSGYQGDLNEYALVYNLPTVSTYTDPYEKGNEPWNATYLGKLEEPLTISSAIGKAGDVDYYSFITTRKGISADTITLTFDEEDADLDLYLFDLSGCFVLGRSVRSEGGTETVSLKGLAQGLYVVKVVSKSGNDIADYTLTFNPRSVAVEPDKYDKNKYGNDTLKKAKNFYALHGKGKDLYLSIHDDVDVDYFKFKIKEAGSSDDTITIEYEVSLGDLDLEILDEKGNVVRYSRTAENTDTVSLKGLAVGNYYIRVSGYNGDVNTYDLSWNITNSSLIPSDSFEGADPVVIRGNGTIGDFTIAKPVEKDETRADVFKIRLDYDAWKSSKLILTNFREDWEDGMDWAISTDPEGKDILASGTGSEISLSGFAKGEYYLTVDTPKDNEYSEYSVIAQRLPDGGIEIENNWGIFIYLAGDNNLEEYYLTELLYMQRAILPEDVEVYVLMDRSEEYAVGERNWSDTRVGKLVHSPGNAVAVQWMYFDGTDTDTYVSYSNLDQMQEWDTGDIGTLEAFLDWGMQTCRADQYALIMKDHGTSLGWNTSDETSNSMLNITEIADLLSMQKYDSLTVTAFDQCLMGSDVVISAMEGVVDYTVASESVGWTPNLLIMYKVLLNSLTSDMTAEEFAAKLTAACNCSGIKDLTLAAFDTSDANLSTALNTFAAESREFSYADWAVVCAAFGNAWNYGDEVCAYSDLITILDEIMSGEVSDVLANAAQTLKQTLLEDVLVSTQITPSTYGTGLAVFNPVQSSPYMAAYSYSGGGSLDFYGTKIGQMEWGSFMQVVGALADDVAHYITDKCGNLTFTEYSYYFADGEKKMQINLGEFSGQGMTLPGLYVKDSQYFSLELPREGVAGDAIRVVADDPDANITITLVQYVPTPESMGKEKLVQDRRVSLDGVLSLDGVDCKASTALSGYTLIVSSDRATSYTLSFESEWVCGVDHFDYARTGSLDPAKGGNNTIDKATKLAAGNYAGLMTYAGDADYYQLNTVYANTLDVVVVGSGLTVKEFDAEGNEIQSAVESAGEYTLEVTSGNYLYIEGSADLAAGEVDGYMLKASDVESTYLSAVLGELPTIEVAADTSVPVQNLTVTTTVSEGAAGYYSTDMFTWTALNGDLQITENGRYYFKSVNAESGIESNWTSLNVECVDNVAPDAPVAVADVTAFTEGAVVVTATFTEDSVTREYSLDNGESWLAYEAPLTFTQNGTVLFRGADAAGNISEITTLKVENIVPVDAYRKNASGFTYGGYYDGTIAHSTLLAVSGGKFTRFFGGNHIEVNRQFVDIEGDVNLFVHGGTFSSVTVGGELVVDGIVQRFGDINFSIDGGTFKNTVAGGMCLNLPKTYSGAALAIAENINFTISGGSFSRRIYGGHVSGLAKFSGRMDVMGDINFTIDATNADISFAENIVAGSSGYGWVHGNVTMTLKKSADHQLNFTGTLAGGAEGSVYTISSSGERSAVSYVEGNTILILESYVGDFDGRLFMFDTIKAMEDTAVNFTNTAQKFGDVKVWEFESGSSMSGVLSNDFSGDTMALDLTGWDGQDWTVMSGTDKAFTGLADFKAVTLGGQSAAWDGTAWVSSDYMLQLEEDENNNKLVLSSLNA